MNAKYKQKCTNCGYVIETDDVLCLPCLIADMKAKMSGSTAPVQGDSQPRLDGKRTITKGSIDTKKIVLQVQKKSVKRTKAKNVTVANGVSSTGTNTLENWQVSPMRRKKFGKDVIWVKCPVCGNAVAEDDMPVHTRTGNCHMLENSATKYTSRDNTWITFVQGGLPGLGKKR